MQYTGTGTTLNTYRAYLKNNSGLSTKIADVEFSTATGDDVDNATATGIMELLVNEMGVEIAPVNGVYNLNGQKVAASTKNLPAGIYVVNGKKISIK